VAREERTRCPACARSAAVLSRKSAGAYRGHTLRDGSSLYTCAYDDCHIDVFQVHASDTVTSYAAGDVVGTMRLERVLHRVHIALGDAHLVASASSSQEKRAREWLDAWGLEMPALTAGLHDAIQAVLVHE